MKFALVNETASNDDLSTLAYDSSISVDNTETMFVVVIFEILLEYLLASTIISISNQSSNLRAHSGTDSDTGSAVTIKHAPHNKRRKNFII